MSKPIFNQQEETIYDNEDSIPQGFGTLGGEERVQRVNQRVNQKFTMTEYDN
jgi:hypothetical protein